LLAGYDVITYSLFAKLLGALILRVLDQFHDTALIGSKASDFTDEITNELGALALNLFDISHKY
jgi:hypothetical protein